MVQLKTKIGLFLLLLIFYGFLPEPKIQSPRWIEPPIYTTQPKKNNTFISFVQQNPGWSAIFDSETGLPHNAYGPGIQIDEGNIIDALKKFMRKYKEIFPRSDELKLVDLEKRNNITYVFFKEFFNGIPIFNGKADFRLKNGKIIFFNADLSPEVKCSTVPRITAEKAVTIASEKFKFTESKEELVIVRNRNEHNLCWHIRTKDTQTGIRYSIFVDALDSKLLYWYSESPTLIYGDVKGLVYPRYGTEPRVYFPFQHEFISTDTTLADTTDELGRFSFAAEPPSRFLVIAELKGLYSDIKPVGASRSVIIYFFPEGEEIRLLWNDSTGTPAEINSYYHINLVHDFFKRLDPTLSAIDYEMTVFVNDTTYPTPENAFWDGRGIHLGVGGRTFDNFALYADVIYHEYTHGVTEFVYPYYLPYTGESGAISEALSDYFACTITGDSRIGEGGLYRGNPNMFMRDLQNTLRMPDNWTNEVHTDGQIIGGAFWDLRTLVGASKADTLIHFARYGGPLTFNDYFFECLVVDDNDEDISNGTPHFTEIFSAFQRHGIGQFRIIIMADPLPDTEDSIFPYTLTMKIVSTLPLQPERSVLRYSLNRTNFAESPIIPGEESHTYTATIPPQRYGSEIWYYIYVEDTAGTVATLPLSAPESLFHFSVGIDTTPPIIYHERIENTPLSAFPLRVTADVFDNIDVFSVSLIARLNGSEPETIAMERVFSNRYVGLINFPSISYGDSIHYAITAKDASSRENIRRIPEEGNFWGFAVVKGYYFDFESSDGGFIGDGDWRWGTPDSETIPIRCCPSGNALWATNLNGSYSSNTRALLRSPYIDLSGFSSATLEFKAFWEFETNYDGGQVLISDDNGVRWHIIEPTSGYTSHNIVALSGPGFTGNSGNFKRLRFDLSDYVGKNIIIGFHYGSDEGVNLLGWYIDDFMIAEKQIFPTPLRLMAESGWNNSVQLKWHPPRITSGSLVLIGYNIYRGLRSGSYNPVPINSSVIADTFFTDSTVTNMTTYYYVVQAIYENGLSDYSNEVMAIPYNARIYIEPDSICMRLIPGRVKDTSLTIYNVGEHELIFSIFEETERIASFTLESPSGEWRLLRTDLRDPEKEKDLKALYAQHTSYSLYLMATSFGSMGNPRSDFIVGFALNTDMNSTTGDTRLWGTDYIVAIGAIPMGGNGIILRYDPTSPYGWAIAGVPHWVYLPSSGDTAACGINLSDIRMPQELIISVGVTHSSYLPQISMIDVIPDSGDSPIVYRTVSVDWLSETPIEGIATPGNPAIIHLTFSSEGLRLGTYSAYLKIVSNDRANSLSYVPVTLVVTTGIVDETETNIPKNLNISSIFPNPSNAEVTVFFGINLSDKYKLEIFNLNGKKVIEVNLGKLEQGVYSRKLNLDNLSTGLYFVQIIGTKERATSKLILLK